MRANAFWYEDRPLYQGPRWPADDFRRHGFYPGAYGGMNRARYAQYQQNWRHFRDRLREEGLERGPVEAAYRRRVRPRWEERRRMFARVHRRAHQAQAAGDRQWFIDNAGVPNIEEYEPVRKRVRANEAADADE